MSDELPPVPIPRNQFEPLHGVEVPPPMDGPDHELWHPTGRGPTTYPTMNHANYAAQARYTSNMGHDELSHPVTVPVGHRGNQTHNGVPTASGAGQYTSIVPGLPQLEYRAPAAPVLNDTPPGRAPLLHHVSSEGHPIPLYSRISAAEDLKHLASQYLFRPGSHVDKLRMRRSRSGGFKVLILLEVEDEM